MGRRYADQRPCVFTAWTQSPLKSDMEYEVVLIDATESPIERPKKKKEIKRKQREEITSRNISTLRKKKTYTKIAS